MSEQREHREQASGPDGVLARLADSAPAVPHEFAAGVMRSVAGLSRRPRRRARLLPWPARPAAWLAPALAGAAATLAVAFLAVWGIPRVGMQEARVKVEFVLHAPDADRVELIGSFNAWQPGAVVLTGPDATGHWHAALRLPDGRHEYAFLVDGREWVADPKALISRPDGFGHENSVIELTGG